MRVQSGTFEDHVVLPVTSRSASVVGALVSSSSDTSGPGFSIDMKVCPLL